MPAPKGNKYWTMRDEHGRKKLFESTPEGLQNFLDLCNEYFNITDKRKWIKKDFIKSGQDAGKIIDIECDTPYTVEGLCQHLQIDSRTFRNYESNENYKDFFPIFSYVRDRIKNQLNEGGLLNAFNPMLVARINQIKDSQDITTNGENIGLHINLSKDEIKNISESLENEV